MWKALGVFVSFIIGAAIFAVMAIAVVIYFQAYVEGMREWFGWEGIWVYALGIAGIIYQIGLVPILIIGAYGAYFGWEWAWYVVIAVFFPGVVWMVVAVAFGGVAALLGAIFQRRRV